jgi:hypothetical protein
VREQLKWWEEKALYELTKSAILDSVRPTDDAVLAYYNDHPARYRNREGQLQPFNETRDAVRRDLVEEEYTKKILHRLLALEKEYQVKIDDSVLRNLPVDAENQPKAIDVYAVKKGGTLPRPAFPTIDYTWQSWR